MRARDKHRQAKDLVDLCSICGNVRKLVGDHCHANGLDRGFICRPCNSGLGMFGDRPEVLRAAAEYLERFKALHGSLPALMSEYKRCHPRASRDA